MKEKHMIVQRTHDEFYIDETRHHNPKEMFKFIGDRVLKNNVNLNEQSICDFGCAAGEFLFYLNDLLPKTQLFGLDLLPELIKKCSTFVPSASLKVGSVLDSKSENTNSFDISFLIGVHSIFDEFEKCFGNLVNWTKPGGKIYVAGMFNPFPVDVMIKYKASKDYDSNVYESGWNIFSQVSVSNFLENHPKVISFSFEKFEIPIDLPRQEDPIRSWTLRDFQDSRFIVNGLCIIQPHYLLEIVL
jgi:SAM-dependent methyltransferase